MNNNLNIKDINKENEELLKNIQDSSKEQVLIEDGTMASFGFNNPSEVQVHR